jgi:hypothetical protein
MFILVLWSFRNENVFFTFNSTMFLILDLVNVNGVPA